MAIETAAEFSEMLEEECVYGIKYEESFHPEDAVPLIEARDAAVALAAKLELLEEYRAAVAELAGHRGCARGYEYNQALNLIEAKYGAAKEPG